METLRSNTAQSARIKDHDLSTEAAIAIVSVVASIITSVLLTWVTMKCTWTPVPPENRSEYGRSSLNYLLKLSWTLSGCTNVMYLLTACRFRAYCHAGRSRP
jgi:hypothetical protein